MKQIFQHIKGDRALWAIIAMLTLFSFMPVYSASTNLVYVVGNGSTLGHLAKHVFLLMMGFAIIYWTHKIPYRYFSGLSKLGLPVVFFLLLFTLLQGSTIQGANASRWIKIPFVGIGFQTSTLAGLILMVYVARYLAQRKNKIITFKESILFLWVPVGGILGLILPANFSTTAIIFGMILMVIFIGGYPIKYIMYILGVAIISLTLFITTAIAFPDVMPNRVNTWKNRIVNFTEPDKTENYQVEKAKLAIATGGLTGKGPGKSVQKNFLPQSSSDFIYAIIVEEFGLIGGVTVLLLYLWMSYRILVIAKKATTIFGTLVVISAGLPIIFQAIVNMAVAVNLFPVTGQTLPLISSGGTSIWMTCISLGIILSVSASKDETEETILDDNPLDILHETVD